MRSIELWGLTSLLLIQPNTCQQVPWSLDEASTAGCISTLQSYITNYTLPAAAGTWGSLSQFNLCAYGNRYYNDTTYRATNNDQWHFGSNTKAMTATVLAILIEKGLLSWTTTLGQALPKVTILSQYSNVTMELLTSHRSGITDATMALPDNWSKYFSIDDASTCRASMVADTLNASSTGSQGTYHYANMNYIIAGAVLEAIYNETAETAMQTLLFGPLSMSVGWGPNPENYPNIQNPWPHQISTNDSGASVVTPYPSNRDYQYADNPTGLNTAGRAHMTMASYIPFLNAHLAGTQGVGSSLLGLSAAAFQKLHTAYPAPASDTQYTYGGWARTNLDDNGHYQLNHAGSNTWNFAVTILDSAKVRKAATFSNIAGGQTGNAMYGMTLDFLALQ